MIDVSLEMPDKIRELQIKPRPALAGILGQQQRPAAQAHQQPARLPGEGDQRIWHSPERHEPSDLH